MFIAVVVVVVDAKKAIYQTRKTIKSRTSTHFISLENECQTWNSLFVLSICFKFAKYVYFATNSNLIHIYIIQTWTQRAIYFFWAQLFGEHLLKICSFFYSFFFSHFINRSSMWHILFYNNLCLVLSLVQHQL